MKVKRVPQRTCVGCRTVKNKKELIRVVRDPDGQVDVDLTGKKSGRGAYICPSLACLEASVKGGKLANALEVAIPEDTMARLREKVSHAG